MSQTEVKRKFWGYVNWIKIKVIHRKMCMEELKYSLE